MLSIYICGRPPVAHLQNPLLFTEAGVLCNDLSLPEEQKLIVPTGKGYNLVFGQKLSSKKWPQHVTQLIKDDQSSRFWKGCLVKCRAKQDENLIMAVIPIWGDSFFKSYSLLRARVCATKLIPTSSNYRLAVILSKLNHPDSCIVAEVGNMVHSFSSTGGHKSMRLDDYRDYMTSNLFEKSLVC